MNKQILDSKEYHDIMTGCFQERHTIENQKKYGVCRWRGMYDNRLLVLHYINQAKRIIDFGGALAPFWETAEIIDQADCDILDKKIIEHQLRPSINKCDLLFSSHTLEHIKQLDYIIYAMAEMVDLNGHIVLHLPSIHGVEYWHPKVKPEHKWVFALTKEVCETDRYTVFIDKKIEKYFTLKYCDFVEDRSILIIGEKIAK